jgi:uncharacterized protein YkwD
MLATSLTRRSLLLLGATTVLAACSTTTIPMKQAQPVRNSSPENLSDEEIMSAINATRRAHGAPAWSYNQQLENAARTHARLMAQKNQFSHDLGGTLRARVTAAGYQGAVGENLAKGYSSIEGTIEGWLKSPGHRQTLLTHRFSEFGLAAARSASGKFYWAMIAGGDFSAWQN